MLKQYLPHAPAGGTPRYWDDNWAQHGDPASAAALERWDPLVPHFLRLTAPAERVLEGGCGLGHYARFLHAAGRGAVGLDFALGTLAAARRRDGAGILVGGNVAALPFRSASFDVYISLGVVEHFEAGPAPALVEARRVLAPGGRLLISVPDFNPLRRLLMCARRRRRPRGGPGGEWVKTDRHGEDPARAGVAFFQYVYTPAEFRTLLHDHGFVVKWHRGYSVVWGLQDVSLVRRILGRVASRLRRADKVARAPGEHDVAGHREEPRYAGLRALVLREEGRGPLTRALLRLFTETCANMRLFVARKEG